MEITFVNFHHATKANWKICNVPELVNGVYKLHDKKADVISSSGSMYWYFTTPSGREYVIRYSNHWSRVNGLRHRNKTSTNTIQCGSVGTCIWTLLVNCNQKRNKKEWLAGKCYLSTFSLI
jgi:hypothetical protein